MLSFIKKLFSILVPIFFITGCQSTISKKESFKPRIAIAGLAIESSTFSPAKTEVDAFLAREGEAVYNEYPFLEENSPQRQAAKWIPTLRGHALPGGIVTREAYDSLVGRTLTLLKKSMPYDGLFLTYMVQ